MSEVSDISSILQNNLRLSNVGFSKNSDKMQAFQQQLNNMPSVLDEDTLTKLRSGAYEITLKEYTDMNTYNTKMTALYGNNSANDFQNTLNIITQPANGELANAKSFVDKMTAEGMSKSVAVRTYSALQKYSLMSSSFRKYNFVNSKV